MANYASLNISNYQNIKEIPSDHSPTWLDTSTAQNWYRAFWNCQKLTSLPDSFYDTSNATNVSWMFYRCENLTSIPNFDTSNVTDMHEMFHYCENLTSIPNFDTSNVINMHQMFGSCFDLTTAPNFNTSNVTDMSMMFSGCWNLTTVPNFDTSNVINMTEMFYYCTNLTNIPTYDLQNTVRLARTFAYTNITVLPNFTNTTKIESLQQMARGSVNLAHIPIWNLPNCTQYSWAFENCVNISGDLYVENTGIFTHSFINIFANCTTHIKNIYCHTNTRTYNSIYQDLGNTTYSAEQNCYLKTIENDYAYINTYNNTQISSIVIDADYITLRFPTNKVQVLSNTNALDCTLEVVPYKDYYVVEAMPYPRDPDSGKDYDGVDAAIITNFSDYNNIYYIKIPDVCTFRFFNGIENTTANYSLL